MGPSLESGFGFEREARGKMRTNHKIGASHSAELNRDARSQSIVLLDQNESGLV